MLRAIALVGLLVAICIGSTAVAGAFGHHPRQAKQGLGHHRCVTAQPKSAQAHGSGARRPSQRGCRRSHRAHQEAGVVPPAASGDTPAPPSGPVAPPPPPESNPVRDAQQPAPVVGSSVAPPVGEAQDEAEEPEPAEEEEEEAEEGGESEAGEDEEGESEEGGESGPGPGAVSAQAEDFAGAPADVVLPAAAGVDLGSAEGCVAIGPLGIEVEFGGVEAGAQSGSVRLQLTPGGSMPEEVRCPTASGSRSFEVTAAAPTGGGVLGDPIDPRYLTELPFGTRSFWIEPWRSYLDTWPASRLLDALGINFNVTGAEAPATAQLLQSSGFRLARIEISWNQLSYSNPGQFVEEAGLLQKLNALRENGLRPLILLNSNSGVPAPAEAVTLTTTAAAAAGSRTVMLDQASAAAVVPERTGFANLSFGGNPDVLITAVDADGRATLSRPLAAELAAGPHPGSTLGFGPFGPPKLADGSTNPEFQRTLDGWLEYVGTVNRLAEEVFGPGNYDFEVWNELSFASEFLDESSYYSPDRVSGSGSVTKALLEATVQYLRDPAHGVSPEVGISDGFAGQTPFAAAGSVPVGTTALSKHLYQGPLYFPRNATINGVRPLDALGQSDATGRNSPFTPKLTPNFGSAFPEYFLTAIQTESLIRDLSPNTNTIYGVPHGRSVGPAGGEPTEVWMTEYNLNTRTLFPLQTGNQDQYIGRLTDAQEERVQAEVVLRSLVAMVNKGLGREYFYAAAHNPGYDLISEGFMDALAANHGAYPVGESGGDTMVALPRMLSRFAGPGPAGAPRQLSLLSIAQAGDQSVWSGDGTAAHPSLYDRDLLAVLPFQSAPQQFVIPVYVMTPNLTTVWDPSVPADSPTRFDLPDLRFRITLGNLPETAGPPQVSAYDPLRDESTPARLVSRAGSRAVFEIAATDYPRLLSIDYPGG